MEAIKHEYYVSLEVAKLLKEAGFDWETEYAYVDELFCPMRSFSSNFNSWGIKIHELVSAPTLDVSQRWLREVKGRLVLVGSVPEHFFYTIYKYKRGIDHIFIESGSPFDTYEEAQEAGIKKTLELILEL